MIRFVLALLFATAASASAAESSRVVEVLQRVQESVVKVYGLGGVAGLEGYQTGVFLEADGPVVLTVDSPVLDGASVTLIDALGDRCEGRVLGRDPATGLALIGLPKSTTPPAVMDLSAASKPSRGQLLWVLSNAFAIATGDEPVTVQRSRLAAVAPMPLPIGADDSLNRPAIGAPAAGTTVLLLDAVTSNPGAGGGVVVDANGSAVGLLGAECRSPLTGAWISYAIPAATVREAIARIEQNERSTASNRRDSTPAIARRSLLEFGIALIPSITARAPAFIEQVTRDSPAAAAGCRADDLIVAVNGLNVGTAEAAAVAINAALRRSDHVELTVLREQRIVNLNIQRVAP